MTQTSPDAPTEFILATDLDGTFAGGSAADRVRLQRALASLEDSRLIYVTGRTVAAARDLIESVPLPQPAVLIADVGTTVAHGSTFEAVAELTAELERAWPGGDRVRRRLAATPGIEEQAVRAPRRVSYWLQGPSMERVLVEMAQRLAGLEVDLVGSAGTYIDVIPGGVNKGTTLVRVLRWLGAPLESVVVAGDTLNDLALFETGLRGVVVGNCEAALRERLAGRDHLYFAAGAGAAGIAEGLLHFGCLKELGDGE
ncbi:MAG: HAD-IIB family hydrolase [Longimicrobiales bacterium]